MAIVHRVLRSGSLARLFLFTAMCFCQTALSQQSSEAPPQTITLSGQVVNSVTGQPVARALVQVGGAHTALTDHEGRFEFDNVTSDPGSVFVSKPGYFPHDEEGVPSGQSITLQLIPEAILYGTVLDQEGQPIQDLQVQLKVLDLRDGVRRWQKMQSTTTNAEGEFRFPELAAGKYALSTGYKPESPGEVSGSTAFIPVAYPPLTGDGVNGAITLTPGDRVEANVNSAAVRLYPVTGQVIGPLGNGLNFTFETIEGDPISASVNFFAAGAFRAMLPSGSFRYKVYSSVGQQQFIGTGELAVAGAPLKALSIHLDPEITIPVEVDYQIVNRENQNPSGPPKPYLMLQDEDPSAGMRMYQEQPLSSSVPHAAADPGGPVAFQNLEPGRYILFPQVTPPWYVDSASCGNTDLIRDPLVLATGTPGCVLRVVLRDDCGQLEYSVSASDTNTAPLHVFIAVIPLGTRIQSVTAILSSGQPTAQGSPPCLAPGRYLIIALNKRQEFPYRDNDAMQPYLSLGQEVTITRNGKADVHLKLPTGEL